MIKNLSIFLHHTLVSNRLNLLHGVTTKGDMLVNQQLMLLLFTARQNLLSNFHCGLSCSKQPSFL